jgi:hypothetical protein
MAARRHEPARGKHSATHTDTGFDLELVSQQIIQRPAVLQHPQPLTNFIGTGSPVQLIEPLPGDYPQRFYRIRIGSPEPHAGFHALSAAASALARPAQVW